MIEIYKPTKRPAYAKDFIGGARCIPKEDAFFLGYQKAWIEDGALEKMQENSRRVGISFSTAYERVKNHADARTLLDTWVSSRDELTARLFVKDCLKFGNVLNAAAVDMGERILEDDQRRGHTVHALAFRNKTLINSVASNADVFAGKGGDVVIDELALRKDPENVLGIALATTDWGGRLASISTHRGSANAFAQRAKEIRDGREPVAGVMQGRGNFAHATLHRVTLDYALQSGFLFKLQSKLKPGDPRLAMDEQGYFDYIQGRTPNREIFLQEYCCVPEDDAAAFLPYSLIDACTYAPGEAWEVPAGEDTSARRFTLGVDIGRDHDLTVISVLEWVGESAFVRELVELQAMPFSAQAKELARVVDKFRPFRMAFDQNGIGRQFTEAAQEKFGAARVEGIKFTSESKEILAVPFKSAFEDRRVRIPRNDNLAADLRAIKKETTTSGNARFSADRGKNGHADRFWSLALAYHAGMKAEAIMEFRAGRERSAVRRRQNRRQADA